MSRQVVILTYGRSGSSMLTRILIELGVFMGHIFPAPDEANPHGYWEDYEFMEINRLLVEHLPHPAPIDQLPNPAIGEKMRAIVEERDAFHDIWGWKNSHTALTVRLWEPFLSDPHYIYVRRSAGEAIASYGRAWDIPYESAAANYVIYTESIEGFIADRPSLTVQFEDLLESKDVQPISEFLGIEYRERAAAVIQ